MKNLIIIPAYNEQESIEKTVEDIKANAPRFDYIVVNDCSKDNTGKICREKKYNVINLPVNWRCSTDWISVCLEERL